MKWNLTATYRQESIPLFLDSPFKPYLFLDSPFEPYVVNPDDRLLTRTNFTVYAFALTENEIESMRLRITDPPLFRPLTTSDKPPIVLGLYLRQYPIMTRAELVRVDGTPEIMPDALKDAPELTVASITFTPHGGCGCPMHHPANPATRDPWARGY